VIGDHRGCAPLDDRSGIKTRPPSQFHVGRSGLQIDKLSDSPNRSKFLAAPPANRVSAHSFGQDVAS
jgi:hypothetical protein